MQRRSVAAAWGLALCRVGVLPMLLSWAAGCSADASQRGQCPPGTHADGAICSPVFGTYCPAEMHFVEGGGCVADNDAGPRDGGADEEGEFPGWFVGRWAIDCDTGQSAYRIERAGSSRVKQIHENGNTYEFDLAVKGDVIELTGVYNGGKQIIRERVVNHKKTHYFYHFFDGSEWPADGMFVKCDG